MGDRVEELLLYGGDGDGPERAAGGQVADPVVGADDNVRAFASLGGRVKVAFQVANGIRIAARSVPAQITRSALARTGTVLVVGDEAADAVLLTTYDRVILRGALSLAAWLIVGQHIYLPRFILPT